MEVLAVIGGFIAGLGALIISVYTSLNSVTQKQLKSMQEENARLLKRIDALEVKLAQRETRIETLETEIDKLQVENRELQQQVILLRDEVDRYRNKRRPQ